MKVVVLLAWRGTNLLARSHLENRLTIVSKLRFQQQGPWTWKKVGYYPFYDNFDNQFVDISLNQFDDKHFSHTGEMLGSPRSSSPEIIHLEEEVRSSQITSAQNISNVDSQIDLSIVRIEPEEQLEVLSDHDQVPNETVGEAVYYSNIPSIDKTIDTIEAACPNTMEISENGSAINQNIEGGDIQVANDAVDLSSNQQPNDDEELPGEGTVLKDSNDVDSTVGSDLVRRYCK